MASAFNIPVVSEVTYYTILQEITEFAPSSKVNFEKNIRPPVRSQFWVSLDDAVLLPEFTPATTYVNKF